MWTQVLSCSPYAVPADVSSALVFISICGDQVALICCLWGIMTEADLKGCISYLLLCHKLPPSEQLSYTGVFSRLPWVRSLCLAGCLAQRLPGCSQVLAGLGSPLRLNRGRICFPVCVVVGRTQPLWAVGWKPPFSRALFARHSPGSVPWGPSM